MPLARGGGKGSTQAVKLLPRAALVPPVCGVPGEPEQPPWYGTRAQRRPRALPERLGPQKRTAWRRDAVQGAGRRRGCIPGAAAAAGRGRARMAGTAEHSATALALAVPPLLHGHLHILIRPWAFVFPFSRCHRHQQELAFPAPVESI